MRSDSVKLGIRAKLFIAYLIAITVVGLPSGFVLEAKLREYIESRIESELEHQTAIAEDLLVELRPPQEADIIDPAHPRLGYDAIADRMGRSMVSRVTIIAPSGKVLGDSELTTRELETVENHNNRPEIAAALEKGRGSARRYSTTLHISQLYVARRVTLGSDHGVVRIARPLSEVEEAVDALRLILIVAGGVAIALAVTASLLVSHLLTRRLLRLVARARRMAKGDSSGMRLEVPSGDELGRLAGTFNRLAGELDVAVSGLSNERDRLQTILDSLEEGVVALDGDGRVTLMNGAAQRLFGTSVLHGLPALSSVGPSSSDDGNSSSSPRSLAELARVPELLELSSGPLDEAITRELDLPLRGGELGRPHRVQTRVAPLLVSGGRVMVMRNVTKTRQLEQIRRDFVANVSHELRTPISVVRANAETLLDGALDDGKHARRFVEAILRHAERLSAIISDLLDLSRMESGRHVFDLGPVPILQPARRACETVRVRAEAADIDVSMDLDDQLICLADRDACEHVVLNLVENAVKYTQRGGKVGVTAHIRDDQVRLEVRDDGPGIPAKHRDRIFERFYRVDPGRSREMGGTGLGLSIVKHLVEGMNGQIGLICPPEGGSIFWIELPTTARREPEDTGAAAEMSQ